MKWLLTFLLLAAAVSAQTIQAGPGARGGLMLDNTATAPTPPPPPPGGVSEDFFKTSWNSGVPAVWPPKDSTGAITEITGARLWDDGVKLGQLFSCSAGSCTTLGPFTGTLKTFLTVNISAFPMNVLYTFGDVPAGATQTGTDSHCASQGGSTAGCIPFSDSDSNQTTCNSTPNSGGTQDSIVIANCGNGTNMQFKFMVWKILSTYRQITEVECWNEPDGAGNFWSNNTAFGGVGSPPSRKNQPPLVRMAAMCNIVKKIAHAIDPNIKVYSPSFHGPTAATWMHRYVTTTYNDSGCTGSCSAAIGGITWPAATSQSALATFDYTNAHIRGGGSGTGEGGGNQSPEAFLGQYANVLAEVIADGLPTLIIDDEWGPVNSPGPPPVCQVSTLDNLAYFVAVGLTVRASVGLYRQYYYQWDSHSSSTSCVNDTGAAGPAGNIAATAWDVVSGWLIGSNVGTTVNTGNKYTVPLTTQGGVGEQIVWNTSTLTQNLTNVTVNGSGFAVYNCSGGCGSLTNEYVTIAGYTATIDNGTFLVTSVTGTAITTNNASGVVSAGTGTATYLPLTCATACPTQSAGGFAHWADIAGGLHNVSGGVVPVGAKPVLLYP